MTEQQDNISSKNTNRAKAPFIERLFSAFVAWILSYVIVYVVITLVVILRTSNTSHEDASVQKAQNYTITSAQIKHEMTPSKPSKVLEPILDDMQVKVQNGNAEFMVRGVTTGTMRVDDMYPMSKQQVQTIYTDIELQRAFMVLGFLRGVRDEVDNLTEFCKPYYVPHKYIQQVNIAFEGDKNKAEKIIKSKMGIEFFNWYTNKYTKYIRSKLVSDEDKAYQELKNELNVSLTRTEYCELLDNKKVINDAQVAVRTELNTLWTTVAFDDMWKEILPLLESVQ